ncbi:hypothetical protein PCASD_05359 [Puccinia coronata f. sp. avenae]|uniref:Uncharacterized protein n=1 Tax=Puccinia coronata f. sp. avenae TaxID=200324 RepID=A0A2N5UND9_9BASI|nr:hypothetical protein PCASD_05359 [Puccinia coronata f. sp. avenae]
MTTDQRSAPSGSGTIQNSNHYLGHQSISLQAAWTNLVQTNWNREPLAEVNPLLTPTNTITSSSSMTDQMINAIELWCRQVGTAFIVWLPHPTEESTIFHCSRHLIIDRIHHNPPLPTLFLNHVLYPTITTKGFTTKLYHINGKGKDAGVIRLSRLWLTNSLRLTVHYAQVHSGKKLRPPDVEKSITTTYLLSVPFEQLRWMGEMSKQALANEAALLDMARLKMVVELAALRTCNTMEVDAPNCLFSAVVSNFFYGSGSGSNLVTGLLAELESYKTLAVWTVEEWVGVFKKWLVDPPSTCIIGRPSAKLLDQLEADTKQRVQDTRQKYGPTGSRSLLTSWPMPSRLMTAPTPTPSSLTSPSPPSGEGAGGSGGAQFGQDNKDDLYA